MLHEHEASDKALGHAEPCCDYWFCVLQIIAPEQDKYIKRTPDGTPMEVALTQGLDHPNIVRTLRHASFQGQVQSDSSGASHHINPRQHLQDGLQMNTFTHANHHASIHAWKWADYVD